MSNWEALIDKPLGPTEWFEIDQQRINAFADTTLDHQSIHIDPQAPATQALGGTIAHGFLGLSILSPLSRELLDPYINGKVVLNYGLNKVRFVTPIAASSLIRLSIKILATASKPQGTLVTYESVMTIKDQTKPAFIAEQLALILD